VRGRLTFADGSILPEAVWDELAWLTERLTVEVAWRAGDVLMLDNTRILHGRRRVEPGDGRLLYTRFCAAAFR
jgi:alpha-ketoglutarate-dependent taurine dioxygenase